MERCRGDILKAVFPLAWPSIYVMKVHSLYGWTSHCEAFVVIVHAETYGIQAEFKPSAYDLALM